MSNFVGNPEDRFFASWFISVLTPKLQDLQIDGSAQNYANSIFRNFTGDRKNFTVCLTLETSK